MNYTKYFESINIDLVREEIQKTIALLEYTRNNSMYDALSQKSMWNSRSSVVLLEALKTNEEEVKRAIEDLKIFLEVLVNAKLVKEIQDNMKNTQDYNTLVSMAEEINGIIKKIDSLVNNMSYDAFGNLSVSSTKMGSISGLASSTRRDINTAFGPASKREIAGASLGAIDTSSKSGPKPQQKEQDISKIKGQTLTDEGNKGKSSDTGTKPTSTTSTNAGANKPKPSTTSANAGASKPKPSTTSANAGASKPKPSTPSAINTQTDKRFQTPSAIDVNTDKRFQPQPAKSAINTQTDKRFQSPSTSTETTTTTQKTPSAINTQTDTRFQSPRQRAAAASSSSNGGPISQAVRTVSNFVNSAPTTSQGKSSSAQDMRPSYQK
ncbi:MAG: hypothetical protein IKF36_04415 [Bacilli bacterium]|nr:hypothetical protein [Bacilli bacterium]